MNTIQKQKAKKFAYRTKMRRKIKYVAHLRFDYWDCSGYSPTGVCFTHLTNFQRWQLPTYRMAILTYPGNKAQFGLSDTSMVFSDEEGWAHEAPDMRALFVSGPREDLSDFWAHFDRVSAELTRYTRRELLRNPALKNDSEWRTFRHPRC